MDWQSIVNLPQVGWATAVSLAVAFALLVWHEHRAGIARREKELEDAEQAYRKAVARRDPDAIRIAAEQLQDARRNAP